MTKQIINIAEQITEMLFTDGQNRKANRLVLEYPQDNSRVMMDGTGWEKSIVKNRIADYLSSQLEPPVKPACEFTEEQLSIIGRAVEKWIKEDCVVEGRDMIGKKEGSKMLRERLNEESKSV